MSNEQWHYSDQTGTQLGPVSTKELKKMISNQQLPTSSMVWKNGMADWLTISQIDELNGASKTEVSKSINSPARPQEKSNNAIYAAPSSDSANENYNNQGNIGGLKRWLYILLRILIGAGAILGIFFAANLYRKASLDNDCTINSPLYILLGIFVLYYLLTFILSALRLKNTGMSGWFAFLLLVPLVNLYISMRCIVCQEGYSQTKKLDLPGIILFAITIVGFIGMIMPSLYIGAKSYKKGADRSREIIESRESQIDQDQPIHDYETIIPIPSQ